LIQMYVDYGYYKEGLINVVRKGASGEQEIKDMMQRLRNTPPVQFAGSPVVQIQDYKTGIEKNIKTGKESLLTLPKSDVLQFYTEDGSKISIRPSGTEPKIKFYISVNAALKSKTEFVNVSNHLDARIQKIASELS
ncbi:MAG TPA: phospho-sugar mutase, partial [Cyclobacteriaceae bacterium]|nr:phospho-sugar mutase [Cyclobacteriaceae bacterium]